MPDPETRTSLRVAGYVLAGGASSRFGRDKAFAELGGKPMLRRMGELLQGVAESVAVVAPSGRYKEFGFRIVTDCWPSAGPLGGIATALLHAGESPNAPEWNLILGCDLPLLTGEWLTYLVERAARSPALAVIPQTKHGDEPLCACYRTAAGPVLAAALERGERKVMRAMEELEREMLDEAQWKRFDNSGRLFRNMNTPADYDAIRAEWEKTPP